MIMMIVAVGDVPPTFCVSFMRPPLRFRVSCCVSCLRTSRLEVSCLRFLLESVLVGFSFESEFLSGDLSRT